MVFPHMGRIQHSEQELAIVCKCWGAKCVNCINETLLVRIYEEDDEWNRCPKCERFYDRLLVHYTSRTMSEWLNRKMARILFDIGLCVLRLMPSSYNFWRRLICLAELHFYTVYMLAVFAATIFGDDFFLLAVLLPNFQYLVHRHVRLYDHVIHARFDHTGPRSQPRGRLILAFDIFTVIGSVVLSSLIVLNRICQTSIWIELMTYASNIIQI